MKDQRLIDANALIREMCIKFYTTPYYKHIIDVIDNAPTVEPERPQDEFVKLLNERIAEGVCKWCQMNKHCELCEISRVFMIIALTNKEMNEGEKK